MKAVKIALPAVIVIHAAASFFAAPGCFAQENEAYDSSFSLNLSTNYDDNLFQSNAFEAPDSHFSMNLAADFTYSPSLRTSYSLSIEHTQNDYSENTGEDHSITSVELSRAHGLSGSTTGVFEFYYETLDAGAASLLNYSYDETDISYSLKHAPGGRGLFKATVGAQDENYNQMDELNFGGRYYKVDWTRELPGFSYLELTYTGEVVNYPAVPVISPFEDETGETRRDRAGTFTAIYSRTLAVYPLRYVEVTLEKKQVSSTSTYLYKWFTPAGLDSKFVSGYDSYDDLAVSLYYMRSLSSRATLHLYYLREKTEYANYLVEAFPPLSEPTEPVTLKLTYVTGRLTYAVGDGLNLEFSVSAARNRADDELLSYSQRTHSLGFNVVF
ncbi:MAG: hypothetical protein AB1742_04005 [bacterium]